MCTRHNRLRGLALRCQSAAPPLADLEGLDFEDAARAKVQWIGRNQFAAVSVRQGAGLTVADCDLSSQSVAAIEVRQTRRKNKRPIGGQSGPLFC